jgi:uncharacterized linocin/CFP29 family protein
MTDLLKRTLAPLTEEAWREVDEAAVRVLTAQLSARTLVDVSGPHGWTYGAVNLGRLEIAKQAAGGVPWGTRAALPLIELRAPIVLDQLEIDNISRGCKDTDLSALEETARKVALFEESAIYKGFPAGQIQGMIPASSHKPIKLPSNGEQYREAVAEGIKAMSLAGVSGPYSLVLGTDAHYALMQSGKGGYPPRRIVRDLLQGEIIWSPAVEGGVMLSARGGDFEMTLGQDLSLGYASHDRDKVELFMTESFTFRVLEPAAVVELKPAS